MYVHATDDSIELVSGVQAEGLTIQVPENAYELPACFVDGGESDLGFDLANALSELVEAELAEQQGRPVGASIAPPDSWLVVVAWVMSQSIANGLTWEAAKVVVQRVVKRLVDLAIAPKGPGEKTTEAGLRVKWASYVEIGKLVKLYHKLEVDAKFKQHEKRK